MLIDMHVHSSFSPCSIINIQELFKISKEKGLDGICITDHDTYYAKKAIQKFNDQLSLLVIVGIEYTTSTGDFLIFGPIDSIPLMKSAEDILLWTKKEGCIAIPAHPFRKNRPVDIKILPLFDIIESMNGRNMPYENEQCKEWIKNSRYNLREIGGSDAHTLSEVGNIITVFDKNIYSLEDLICELRRGKYFPLQMQSYQNSTKPFI